LVFDGIQQVLTFWIDHNAPLGDDHVDQLARAGESSYSYILDNDRNPVTE
jgi:hypothetical protein